jgi:metal-sulfur cluster biosynthetic enzyme
MNFNPENNKKELLIYNRLKTVIDPELAINIIDLGLVYKIQYDESTGTLIELTLSSPGCPMGDVIMNEVEEQIRLLFPEKPVEVKLVWEPRWSPDFITPAGKAMLNKG